MRASPVSIDAAGLLGQLGPAYAMLPADARAAHPELLACIGGTEPVALHAIDRVDGRWTLSIAARDAVGTLSIIAGMLTAARFNIETADIFTVLVPMPTRPGSRTATPALARRALDVFQVRAPGGTTDATWTRWREGVAELLDVLTTRDSEEARNRLVDRVAEVLRSQLDAEDRLWPVTVSALEHDRDTALRIQGQDTPGFLFALTNALALLGINIVRAEIRTLDGESDDLFWVSDAHGERLDAQRIDQVRAAVALIKQFTVLLPHAPNPAQALTDFSALTRQLLARADWSAELPALASPEVQRTLADLLGTSAFLWDDFLRMQYSNLFPVVGDVTYGSGRRTKAALEAQLQDDMTTLSGFEARKQVLNAFKDREMFRIDLRHIREQIDFRSFSAELTDLADLVIAAAAQLVVDQLGPPPCAWAICGLGKFGGQEMGFASDVEALFVYADDDRPGGDETARYFDSFVRSFIGTLATQREGIFELDLRLRPHGNAGPLASSLSGLAAYYDADGPARQFERMALVKLRPVAGDVALGRHVEARRNAYVYSGSPLDRGDISHLRTRQATELVPAGVVNAKYSAGGVVDLEYWVQARQIEAGHSDDRVRVPNTLLAVQRLREGGHVEAALAQQITATYSFLRRLIDALRVVRGHARDLAIPSNSARDFAYLARRLGTNPAALDGEINRHMAFARDLSASRTA
jgi:glutamate-ammonia-ligase adenylyltransferase